MSHEDKGIGSSFRGKEARGSSAAPNLLVRAGKVCRIFDVAIHCREQRVFQKIGARTGASRSDRQQKIKKKQVQRIAAGHLFSIFFLPEAPL